MAIIAALDTETTGLTPGDHRFVEVYVGLWETETWTKVEELLHRINPERSIQPEAQRVHNISFADVQFSPTWDKVAGEIRTFIERGDLIVAHNGDDFDLPFLNYEMNRVKLPKLSKPSFDTMKQGRGATANGKLPNLQELCWSFDVPYDPKLSHRADYDVAVMFECFRRGVTWGFFNPKEFKSE